MDKVKIEIATLDDVSEIAELGYIGSLGVDKKYRCQGIGTKLISVAESWCKEHNIGAIELDVFAFNDSAE